MQAQRLAGVAARSGLITGLFLGILSLPVITLISLTGALGRGMFFFLSVALIAFAVAGYIATRRSGLLRSGVGAGALAALITLFIAICLGIVIVALLAPHAALTPLAPLSGIAGRGGHGGRGVFNPGARPLARPRTVILGLLIFGVPLVMGVGVLGGFLGGLLTRLGRARPSVVASAGPAPQFTPPPAPPLTPAAPAYPSNPSSVTPPPYYPPAPPYDPNAPTNPSSPRSE